MSVTSQPASSAVQIQPAASTRALNSDPARSRAKPVARMKAERGLFSFPKYWAKSPQAAPFLPMSRKEMDQLGWDSCDTVSYTHLTLPTN